jgi:hypothetical protein
MEKLLSSTAETEMSLDAFKLMAIVPSQQNTPTPGKLHKTSLHQNGVGNCTWGGPPDYTANFS